MLQTTRTTVENEKVKIQVPKTTCWSSQGSGSAQNNNIYRMEIKVKYSKWNYKGGIM